MGKLTKVNAVVKDLDLQLSVNYDFGDTLEEAVEKFGADVVHSKFVASAKVDLQGIMRRAAVVTEKDEDGNETISAVEDVDSTVAAAAADWKPGVTTRQVLSPKEKARQAIGKLSSAEREELLAQLAALEDEEAEEVG